MMENKSMWEKLHKEARFRPKYPSELVVQFIFRNFKRDGNEKVLDLGCGAGRHTIFMANENIIPYGVDISKKGVKHTKDMLKNCGFEGFNNNIKCGDFSQLEFKDDFFDGIICYGVLYYSKKEDIKKAVDEIYRVLQKDGKALVVVRNTEDYRFRKGKKIEENTFIINENDGSKCAYNENDMVMHFFTKEEVKNLFSRFSSVMIDMFSETHENEKYKDSNYILIIRK